VSKYPAIPEATQDPRSLKVTVDALKESVELLTGQRRGLPAVVTWEDLVRLGLISETDVPR
jgi:hypothetical protein